MDLKPNCIVISGDLTTRGDKQGLKYSLDFMQHLACELQVEPSAFVVVPGNHEVDWNAVKPLAHKPVASKAQYKNTLSQEGLAEYRKVMESFWDKELDPSLTSFWSGDDVFVLGLNSCYFEGPEHKGVGFVGTDQLEWAEAKLGNHWRQHGTRIAVLHHHLVPVTHTNFRPAPDNISLTLNAPDILAWLARNGFQVALHGHQHQPFSATELRHLAHSNTSQVIVLGAGSAGAVEGRLGHVKRRQYQYLQSLPRRLKVRIRSQSSSIPTAFEDAQTIELPLCCSPIPIMEKVHALGLHDFHWFDEVPWREYFAKAKTVEVFAITARRLVQDRIDLIRELLRRYGTKFTLLIYDPSDDEGLSLFDNHFDEPGQRKRKIQDVIHELDKLGIEPGLRGSVEKRFIRGPLKFKYTYYKFDDTILYVPYQIEGRRDSKLPVFVAESGDFLRDYLADDLKYLHEVSKS